MSDLATRLRTACDQVRVKSYPLSDLIPLMQQAADALAAAPRQPAPSAAPGGSAVVSMDATDNMMAAFAKTAAAEIDWYGATEIERQEVRDGLGPAYRAMLAAAPQSSPTHQADSQPAPVLDMAVMQLAESVGLIGPASRVHDLHAAIQRFHDLICVNATIKAAVMAADAISGAATSARDYPPLPMQFACSGVFPVYSADQMRAYVDADRAARAPADSVLEDAARYQWLAPRLLAADFDYQNQGECVLVFEWPKDVAVGGDCSQNIDAARKQGGA